MVTHAFKSQYFGGRGITVSLRLTWSIRASSRTVPKATACFGKEKIRTTNFPKVIFYGKQKLTVLSGEGLVISKS